MMARLPAPRPCHAMQYQAHGPARGHQVLTRCVDVYGSLQPSASKQTVLNEPHKLLNTTTHGSLGVWTAALLMAPLCLSPMRLHSLTNNS